MACEACKKLPKGAKCADCVRAMIQSFEAKLQKQGKKGRWRRKFRDQAAIRIYAAYTDNSHVHPPREKAEKAVLEAQVLLDELESNP